MAELLCVFLVALVASVQIVQSQDTFTSATFPYDGTLTVTCNANTAQVPSKYQYVSIVKLSQDGQSMAYITLAPPESKKDQVFSSWNIVLKSDGSNPNRDLISITATKTNAKCSEAKNYTCEVTAAESGSSFKYTNLQTWKTEYPLSSFQMDVNPDFSTVPYDANSTVTMTGFATGGAGYKFQWQRKCPKMNEQFFTNWPDASNIQPMTTTDAQGSSDLCPKTKYEQRLIFTLTSEMDECMVRCNLIDESSRLLDTDNKTFPITSGQEPEGEGTIGL